jgi:SAM-dependent methyltransferase
MAFAGLDLPDLVILPSSAQDEPRSLARYEPSSPAIIKEMLTLAEVSKDDVVYDLGSGDGRVLIAAARRGARGLGVDIDRGLVEESKKNAEKANVSHLVQFVEQDLSRTHLSEASVVMLYLSPDANLMLRPRLLRELRPGSRVVSHSHDMGEWKPDKKSEVENHHIFSWVVPADVQGAWTLKIADKYGSIHTLEFDQTYQDVTARLQSDGKSIPVNGARVKGKTVIFTLSADLGPVAGPAEFTGEVEGSTITGRFRAKNRTGEWTAKRGSAPQGP